MKIGYFDCIGGASGDMILGALVDAGVSLSFLNGKFRKLPITGWSLKEKKIVKNGISAASVEVQIKKQIELRNLQTIESLLKKSLLPKVEIEDSIKIFRRLAEAEARVHGTTIESVHFHEIGAVDTIIDVVGAVCGLRLLGIEHVIVSPFPIGKVGPAAIELLKDFPVFGIEEQRETVTPTGAAILSTLATNVISRSFLPPCRIKTIGYGAGKSDFQSRPNVLRLVIGKTSDSRVNTEILALLETNIDDVNPQVYDYVGRRLFEEGALDVWMAPIQMKKNRPAVTLSILCRLTDEKELSGILFKEGLTLGIRRQLIDRASLPREIKTVKTKFGGIRVKMARYEEKIVRCVPEYEDCKKIAAEQSISIQEVMTMAKGTALSTLSRN
jgi:uncharacterized protein (TIGR00299 family) protein